MVLVEQRPVAGVEPDGDLLLERDLDAAAGAVADINLDLLAAVKVGDRVGELIGEAQLIDNWEAYADDVAPVVHAHPTQNEALGDAHLDAAASMTASTKADM